MITIVDKAQHLMLFNKMMAWLEADIPFAYTKINHGFWENLVKIEQKLNGLKADNYKIAWRLDRETYQDMMECGFLDEILTMFQQLNQRPKNLLTAFSYDSSPGSNRTTCDPTVGKSACERIFSLTLPSGYRNDGTGLEFKMAAISGDIKHFFDYIANKPSLLIGGKEVALLSKFIGAADMKQMRISSGRAKLVRQKILAKTQALLEKEPWRKIILIQAGSLSFWLTVKLQRLFPAITLLDIGMPLDLGNFTLVDNRKEGWDSIFREDIMKTVETIHPGWMDKKAAYPGKSSEQRQRIRDTFRYGCHPDAIQLTNANNIAPPQLFKPKRAYAGEKLAFIENKIADYSRIQALMQLSERQNSYVNGGPISSLLEKFIHQLLELDDDRAVVVCSSCTMGLKVLAGLEAIKRGRPLRWLGSAFTFFSSYIATFSDINLVDCDERGILSEKILASTPIDSYDGIVFTNVFGYHHDWSWLERFCRKNNKALVIDNALGLLDRPDKKSRTSNEAISCHQTKPWGAGEGGFIIVKKDEVTTARQFLNFGKGLTSWSWRYADNGKISDLACAAIYERLERIPSWEIHYHWQKKRCLALINNHNIPLTVLGETRNSPPAYVSLLAEQPIDASMLDNPHFTLLKYYRPPQPDDYQTTVSASFTNADRLYQHIVNVPCHPDMVHIDNDTITNVLLTLANK
ncbi:MAG: hypothetical protein GY821_11060 [Gammaproteobacteria bacterium]|nr:hypothetical protein [Gammaproteobacteria bacterium]